MLFITETFLFFLSSIIIDLSVMINGSLISVCFGIIFWMLTFIEIPCVSAWCLVLFGKNSVEGFVVKMEFLDKVVTYFLGIVSFKFLKFKALGFAFVFSSWRCEINLGCRSLFFFSSFSLEISDLFHYFADVMFVMLEELLKLGRPENLRFNYSCWFI